MLRSLLNSSATVLVHVTLLCTAAETASCYAMAKGNCLLLLWRRSTASSVFRVGARGRAFTLSPPPPSFPSLPPSLISHLASVDVKQNVYLLTVTCATIIVRAVPGNAGETDTGQSVQVLTAQVLTAQAFTAQVFIAQVLTAQMLTLHKC